MSSLVSIIIPAYNMEKYLDESIQSALQQSYSDKEIIVVDDCSTDNTQKIALKYKDRGVRYTRLDVNSGVATAMKTGFDLATGDFLSFLSADDFYVDIHKTSKQIEIMKQKKADWSYYRSYYSGINFKESVKYQGSFIPHLNFLNSLITRDPDLMFMALLFVNPINSASMMITRECLQKGGTWDPQWKNADPDGDLFLRYCREKLRCIVIKGAPIFYRIHENQLSANENYMQINSEKVRLNALMQINSVELITMIKKFKPFFWWYKTTGVVKRRPSVVKFLEEVINQ